MEDYELVLIFNPAADNEAVTSMIERVSKTVREDGGSLGEQKEWGVRRLAYPIQHFNEGNYVITELNMETKTATKVEKSLVGAQGILRHLLVKKG